jgi:hypothetical protein
MNEEVKRTIPESFAWGEVVLAGGVHRANRWAAIRFSSAQYLELSLE